VDMIPIANQASKVRSLMKTGHIIFITAGPGTDSVGPDDIKLLNRSGCPIFFLDHSNSNVYTVTDHEQLNTL